jgi:Tfp pilus assembly protein PilF
MQVLAAISLSILACAHAAPYRPTSDAQVLERLPQRPGDRDARELSALRAAAAKSPNNPVVVAQLAQRYFDLAMARGDPRYVGYAEALVARFPAPLPASLLAVRGQLRQFGHDFDGALQDFASALALEPDLASAHAWRGAIFLVQAQYDRALAECMALDRLGRRSLHAGCLGLAQAYGGRLQEAQLTLQQALDGSSQPEQRLWLLTRLGEVAAWRAQPAQAERYYREALALGLDDGYLLAAWSDFLLDAGRPAEVIEWLSSWEASDPLLLRLAEAESALGRPEAARHLQVLEDRFAAARLRGDTTHRAEEARYRLRLRGDAEAALRLAVENYRLQREPRDARILLEAATAAGDAQAAAAVKDWLRTSGFEDPRLRQLAQASANRTGSAAGSASGRP